MTNTGRDVEEYLTSLKYRMNGKFKRIPHYIVTKDGKIIQTLPDEAYSDYFTELNVNRNSIIISFENLGWLEKVPLKDYYTNWIGNIYKGSAYEKKWRDYFLWQPYTEVQIDSTILICKKLMEDFNISKKCVGHNTKVNGVNQFEGIVTRSNYTTDVTDLSPAFDFEKFNKLTELHKKKPSIMLVLRKVHFLAVFWT